MRRKFFIFILLVSITIFCFFKFDLGKVVFIYPKDAEVNYKKVPDLKEIKALGFTFLSPKNSIVEVKKKNIVGYIAEDVDITFVLKTNRPVLMSGKNGYKNFDKILSNKWNPWLFALKYFIVSRWQDLEIKRIKMNNLRGFILIGTKKDRFKERKTYLYELFNEDHGFMVDVSVNKLGNFNEKEINYLVSTIRKVQE